MTQSLVNTKRKTRHPNSRKRRSRYIVAALKACRAICQGRTKQELHPAVRLEAAKLIVAIEHGVALPTINDRLLRRIIAEEVASGEINQTLLRMAGLLDRVEKNQRKVIAPFVEEVPTENVGIAPVAKPDVPTEAANPQSSASDDLQEILQKLKSKGDQSKMTVQTSSHQPKESTTASPAVNPTPRATKLMPRVPVHSHLSDDENAAVHEFAEFRISAAELESALSPYLKVGCT
jgi:hypothetical protein